MPIADFKMKEEAEEYIRSCRKEDQLGREFEAWFQQRIQALQIPRQAGMTVIHFLTDGEY